MTASPRLLKHSARSRRWLGHPRSYQREAQRIFAIDRQRVILPWSWVTTDHCDVEMCLEPACMTLHESKAIKYPIGVCVYCGNVGGTRDHLIPKPISGEVLRHRVLTVPACADCNNRIGDFPSYCVTERRQRAHDSIRKNNKGLLAVPDKTYADLRPLGPALRSVAIKNNHKREAIRLRLSWPDDPYFDLRAFQRSGVDDPVAVGLVAGVDRTYDARRGA